MPNDHQHPPSIFIIFGGSGDLAKRKLVPALYNLYIDGHLPEHFAIIGLGRTEYSNETYQEKMKKEVGEFSRRGLHSDEQWGQFAPALHYVVLDVFKKESYEHLMAYIGKLEKDWIQKSNLLFYLSVAPELVEPIAESIGASGICENIDRSRIVVEKPFGFDLESAQALNQKLTGLFDERQIYRIDHYLGKEAVQNMLVFRFANTLFEPIWNRNFIEQVQITASETVGLEDRAGYYDQSGALKDMIQNHVLQLLCFVAMEPPMSFSADEIRNRKVDVLRAIRKYEPNEVPFYSARGQYGAGSSKGEPVKAYREEPDVKENSPTETFAAVQFFVDNFRWQGVPFYVRSGKRLPKKMSLIHIQFKEVPHRIFPENIARKMLPNGITISISPDTGIKLSFQAKQVGLDMQLEESTLITNPAEGTHAESPEAYETLLHDIMVGDATLFMRSDEVENAWKVVMPIVQSWQADEPEEFPNYESGSWGPKSAEQLMARNGHSWENNP